MARKNLVILTGIVSSEPKFRVNQRGIPYIRFRLLVGRYQHNGKDEPIIEVEGPLANELNQTLSMGDSVHVEGWMFTRRMNHNVTCEQCHKVTTTLTMLTSVMGEQVQNLEVLNSSLYHENHVFMISTLTRNPERYQTRMKMTKTKYQIAVNRPDFMGGADFPYVCSYSDLAEKDAVRLVKGSQLFIDGVVQTAKRTKKVTCDHCSGINQVEISILEIVPKSTEYLNNCVFPENNDPNHWKNIELEIQLGGKSNSR